MPAAVSECLYLPQIGCAWGVHMYPLENVKLDHMLSRGPQIWHRTSGQWKVCAGIWGTHDCGVPVG